MSEGFIKLNRSDAARELLLDGNAFLLLTLIAFRAKRTGDFSVHGLKIGQALVGDYTACGLTEQQYRSAKVRLKRYGLADFKATPRGTIATLLDNTVYDINVSDERHPGNGRITDEQRTANDRATTNKNDKNDKNERTPASSADAEVLAELLLDLIRQRQADFREPNLARWARDLDRLIRLDKRDPQRIEAVLHWCQRDPFWRNNILSGAALRKHFDRLELKMGQHPSQPSTAEMIALIEKEEQLR